MKPPHVRSTVGVKAEEGNGPSLGSPLPSPPPVSVLQLNESVDLIARRGDPTL